MLVVETGLGLKTNLGLPSTTGGDGEAWLGEVGDVVDRWSEGSPGVREGRGLTGDSRLTPGKAKGGRTELLN